MARKTDVARATDARLIRMRELQTLVGMRRSTIHRLISEGRFPSRFIPSQTGLPRGAALTCKRGYATASTARRRDMAHKKQTPPSLGPGLFDKRNTPAHDPELERCIKQTYPGQAGFAGWRAPDAPCTKCWHYAKQITDQKGRPKKARAGLGWCRQHPRLMRGEIGASFPNHARACRYFAKGGEEP